MRGDRRQLPVVAAVDPRGAGGLGVGEEEEPVAEQFHALKNAREGSSDVEITSAFPLDDSQTNELVAALERKFGRKLYAKVAVDPSLIGGVSVKVGDEVLDTSVRARLAAMQATLTA